MHIEFGVGGHEIICAVTCQSLARFCHSKLFNFPHRLELHAEHSLVCYLTYISDTKSLFFSSLSNSSGGDMSTMGMALTTFSRQLGLCRQKRQISQDEASSWWKTQQQPTIKTLGGTWPCQSGISSLSHV